MNSAERSSLFPEPAAEPGCCGTRWGYPFNVLVFPVTAHLGGVRVITAA